MRLRFLHISLIMLTAATQALAQAPAAKDSVIKGATIEIIQSYKPEVKQVPKPEIAPALPPADTTHPVFKYEVPQQTLYYTYNSPPLRPLALGKDTSQSPFPDYVKLGGGNLSTIYLDAGFGILKGKNYETAFHLGHLSQKGKLANQQTSLSDLELDGSYHMKGADLHANLSGMRNRYSYYGYDHDSISFANIDSLKQIFTGMRLGIDMGNDNSGKKFNYHPAIYGSFYGDRFKASETSFGFNLPFAYAIDESWRISVAFSGDLTQYKVGSLYAFPNNIFSITPGISFNKGIFHGHAYVSPTFGQSTNYLPDLLVGFMIPKTQLMISAGWKATVRRNTFEELSSENPYMFNIYTKNQTRCNEIFAGIQSNVGKHFSFAAKFSWFEYTNLPLFLSDSGDGKQFYVVNNAQVNATSLQASVRYQTSDLFSIGLNGTFTKYYNSTTPEVWQVPTMRIKADVMVHPLPQLTVGFYFSAIDGMTARTRYKNTVDLDGIMDMGLNAEYLIIPRLSVFLQANNLLNNQYQRWLGYPSYGFNIYGGLRVKF